jgi:CheY-like chemotaxis protein
MFGRTHKEIRIHFRFDKMLRVVEADCDQTEQVLLNLFVNAAHAMPDGGDLFLETENTVLDEGYVKPYNLLPGRYIKISVTDTGIGMDKATQQRVFEPFFTTKEMGRGTGLGLATAYGIIRNHGGIINVYSEKGKGTTFTIYLPASEKHAAKEHRVSDRIIKGTGLLLLADDEDMILDVGRQMLTELGYEVLTANSGKAALQIYQEHIREIDLVILDMVMPEMSGATVFTHLKQINPDVKVLLSSGYSINGQAAKILEQGCKGFIQKPFTLRYLSEKVSEILK